MTTENATMSMIERVARTILVEEVENLLRSGGYDLPAGVSLDEWKVEAFNEPDEWRRYDSLARAAIGAMREPTLRMAMAGDAALQDESSVWKAMIDQALNDENG